MRRVKSEPLKGVWENFLEANPHIKRKISEAKIPQVWGAIVGDKIATYTTSIDVERGVLYATISSAPARHSLFLQRDVVARRINEYFGDQLIKTVIVK